MKDVVVYLDDDADIEDFSPDQDHKIPRFEMARVATVSAAMQGILINLEKRISLMGF